MTANNPKQSFQLFLLLLKQSKASMFRQTYAAFWQQETFQMSKKELQRRFEYAWWRTCLLKKSEKIAEIKFAALIAEKNISFETAKSILNVFQDLEENLEKYNDRNKALKVIKNVFMCSRTRGWSKNYIIINFLFLLTKHLI